MIHNDIMTHINIIFFLNFVFDFILEKLYLECGMNITTAFFIFKIVLF